jgi:UrcA family protein
MAWQHPNFAEISMQAFTIVAAAAALSCSVLTSACAQAVAAPSIKVRYADLDLSRVKDATALYKRLNAAARAVCRDLDSHDSASGDLRPILEQHHKACMDNAIIGAVAKIDRPAFTSFVATKMTLPDPMSHLELADSQHTR